MSGPTDRLLNSKQYRRLRLLVLERDRWLCQIRGPRCSTVATEVDHIVARADGGDVYAPANLRAACKRCNGYRAAERTNRLRYSTTLARYETRL